MEFKSDTSVRQCTSTRELSLGSHVDQQNTKTNVIIQAIKLVKIIKYL